MTNDRLQTRPITDEEAVWLIQCKDLMDCYGGNDTAEEKIQIVLAYGVCIPNYISDGPGYTGLLFLFVGGFIGAPVLSVIKDDSNMPILVLEEGRERSDDEPEEKQEQESEPTLESRARAMLSCPACGRPKAKGLVVCWDECYRGPNGYKRSLLSANDWLERHGKYLAK